MRWRYVFVVGGVAAALLAWDLYWTWREDHQEDVDRLVDLEWPGVWRDTSE